jgi:hypothetical protein
MQGMTSGVRKIRNYLRGRGMNDLPQMLQDKARALGWNPL